MIKQMLMTIIAFFAATVLAANPHDVNKMLGRGINLGNWLEAPKEGEWGVTIQESYFKLIADKGFNSLRIPVRWSTAERAGSSSPYTVSSTFLDRVKWAVDNTLKNKMCAVINMHHYEELFDAPESHTERFKEIWKQVSAFFKDYPDSLLFEILNEPHGNLTSDKWNTLLAETLSDIRVDNPNRTIVVGTAEWGGVGAMNKLVLPSGETNIILTVHYYAPFQFTHQGAGWVSNSDPWLGTTWDGTPCEKTAVKQDMETVKQFAKSRNLPVYVGEFGVYSKADMDSRVRWTAYCARIFESFGFSWSYWEFCAGFGIYDTQSKTFRDGLTNALISEDTSMLNIGDGFAGTNIIKNGDFANGKTDWSFGIWTETGAATGEVENGAFHAVVTELPPNAWNCQLLQNNLALQKDEQYALIYDAWTGGNDRSIGVSVMNSTDYTSYGGGNAIVAKEKKTLTTCFSMTADRTDGQIAFSFGGELGGVYIDNVKLVKLDATTAAFAGRGYRCTGDYYRSSGNAAVIGGLHDFRAGNLSGQCFRPDGKRIRNPPHRTAAGAIISKMRQTDQ